MPYCNAQKRRVENSPKPEFEDEILYLEKKEEKSKHSEQMNQWWIFQKGYSP